MKIFFIATFILFVKFTSISAQTGTTIIGAIKDRSNLQRVEGSNVSLINTKDSALLSFVRTDTSGQFIFERVPNGKYKLSATYTGFHPYWISFNVNGQSILDLGEILIKDNSLLDEIIVGGEKPPVTINGTLLNLMPVRSKPSQMPVCNRINTTLIKSLCLYFYNSKPGCRVSGQSG